MSDPLWWQAAGATSTGVLVAQLLIAIILSSSFLLFRRKDDRKITKYPPYAPIGVWTILKARMNKKSNAYWMLDIARELKSQVFQLSVPSFPIPRSIHIVGESSTSRKILLHSSTTKPDIPYQSLRLVFGNTPSVFTLNVGPEWHAKRKAVAPAFSYKYVKRMNRVALEKTEDWINKYNSSSGEGEGGGVVVDVAHEMIGIVLSSICETAFEYEMSTTEQEYFTHELELALVEYARKAATIPLRLRFGQYFISETRRAQLAVQNLIQMVYKIMSEYGARTTHIDGTIIQLIMQSHVAYPTDQEKAAELLTYLVAGHDTTGYSIAFTLIELAKNKHEQIKLRDSLSTFPPENWSNCEQLKWAVKEGMRLHPVGRSARTVGQDFTTSRDETITKGSVCIILFALNFRDVNIFSDPDSFIPSRWANPTKEMNDAVMPFSLGKQNCVGQSLAMAESYGIIARICSEYELILETEGCYEYSLTVKPVGFMLRFRKWV